jgi:hypothetical protein
MKQVKNKAVRVWRSTKESQQSRKQGNAKW